MPGPSTALTLKDGTIVTMGVRSKVLKCHAMTTAGKGTGFISQTPKSTSVSNVVDGLGLTLDDGEDKTLADAIAKATSA